MTGNRGLRHLLPVSADGLCVRGPASVAAARSHARDWLAKRGLSPLEDTVTLLVSEMVTNALLHTNGIATLELRHLEGRVRIMVGDAHATEPTPRHDLDTDSASGRGMILVEILSEEWGVVPCEGGKWVWADVTLAS